MQRFFQPDKSPYVELNKIMEESVFTITKQTLGLSDEKRMFLVYRKDGQRFMEDITELNTGILNGKVLSAHETLAFSHAIESCLLHPIVERALVYDKDKSQRLG